MKYNGGPAATIPEQLIHTDDQGNAWVKFRPPNYAIAKLVLGHMDEYHNATTVNLSSSPQWKAFQGLQKDAIAKELKLDTGGNEVFDEEEDQQEDGDPNRRSWKKLLERMGSSMVVQLEGVNVQILTPKSWKSTDVHVKLESAQLKAFCDFICKDVDACFGDKRRAYKRKRKDGDEEQEKTDS